MIIKLHPRKEWVSAKTKEELANRFKEALSIIPGIDYEFTQPIEMRFNELITGVRADLAIKIYGEDLELLNQKALEAKALIDKIPGAADVIVEKTAGLPQMSVRYKRNKLAFYNLSVEELNRYLSMAFGGEAAGNVFEGERRFDLVIRLHPDFRNDIEHIRNLFVALPGGEQIPLSALADIRYTNGPAKISRDNTHRRVVVSVNVRNSDLQTVVDAIRPVLDQNLGLPPGYSIEYGGQFENLNNASRRLQLAVPLALLLIFIFLHFAFGSLREAIMVYSAVPLSAVGGVLSLWIRGMPFSISAGVGFIALFGIAVLNGIVLIEHLKELKKEGVMEMKERIMRGTKERLRPVFLTASAAAMGFFPMAVSTSAGAEVQRPLATVVIGGLITSTMLTMIALPLLYSIFDNVTGIRIRPFKLIRRRIIPVLLLILLPIFSSKAQYSEIGLEQAILLANRNNSGLKAWEKNMEAHKAMLPASFSVEKTSVYYEYDQNNVAENGFPLGVLGIEQSFDFPGVYFAQRKAAGFQLDVVLSEYEKNKRMLIKHVTKAYYHIVCLLCKQQKLARVDSVYSGYTKAALQKHDAGDISNLDMLNAQSKHSMVKLKGKQLVNDLDIAHRELNALLQSDSLYTVVYVPMNRLKLDTGALEQEPGYRALIHSGQMNEALLQVEKNKLLPGFTLGYFNGTNPYANARNYFGYHVGLSLPLFFGEQKAKIDVAKINREMGAFQQRNYALHFEAKQNALFSELKKYAGTLDYYENEGMKLSDRMIRAAEKSHDAGEIDFFRFVHTVEDAIQMEIDYLDNLDQYNQIVLDINYLTIN